MRRRVLTPHPGLSTGIGYYLGGMEEVRRQLQVAVRAVPEELIGKPAFLGAHSIGGLVLHIADSRRPERKPLESVSLRDSLLIGLAQSVALVPGMEAYAKVLPMDAFIMGGGGSVGGGYRRNNFVVWLYPSEIGRQAVARSYFTAGVS